jgi:hypothetical protein
MTVRVAEMVKMESLMPGQGMPGAGMSGQGMPGQGRSGERKGEGGGQKNKK